MNMFGQKNIDLSTAGSIPTPESPYYDFRFPPRNNDNTRIFQTGPPGRMQLRGYEISGIAAWKRLKNNRTQGPGNLRIKTSDSLPSLPITSADKWMDELVHDLRNSTAAITAGMDLLRGNPDNFTSPRDQKIAEMMSRNTKKLKSYTQSLLNSSASQCRSGKPAGFDSCELVRLLSNCFDTLKAQYPVRIVFDTGGQGSINGIWRTEPLERAIDNLLSNAAKFGDPVFARRLHLCGHDRSPWTAYTVWARLEHLAS